MLSSETGKVFFLKTRPEKYLSNKLGSENVSHLQRRHLALLLFCGKEEKRCLFFILLMIL